MLLGHFTPQVDGGQRDPRVLGRHKYNKVADGEKLFMGNVTSSKMEGKGIVKMKFISGKILTLVDCNIPKYTLTVL